MEMKNSEHQSHVVSAQQFIITNHHDHRSTQPRDNAPVVQLLLKVVLRSFVLLEVLLLLRSGHWSRLRLGPLVHVACKP